MVSSDLATYKTPRAIAVKLLYQQSSSTTLYYSYLRASALIEVRPWNETGEITYINALARATHLASSGLAT